MLPACLSNPKIALPDAFRTALPDGRHCRDSLPEGERLHVAPVTPTLPVTMRHPTGEACDFASRHRHASMRFCAIDVAAESVACSHLLRRALPVGHVRGQSEEVPAVACTRFQVPGSDFSHGPTKPSIPAESVNCYTLDRKGQTLIFSSAGHLMPCLDSNTHLSCLHDIQ